MKDWSRRNVLRAGAGAAIAVPMAALGGGIAGAVERRTVSTAASQWSEPTTDRAPVMFCIHDAERGEVSILHGPDEVIVTDRRLVARILQAADARSATAGQNA